MDREEGIRPAVGEVERGSAERDAHLASTASAGVLAGDRDGGRQTDEKEGTARPLVHQTIHTTWTSMRRAATIHDPAHLDDVQIVKRQGPSRNVCDPSAKWRRRGITNRPLWDTPQRQALREVNRRTESHL